MKPIIIVKGNLKIGIYAVSYYKDHRLNHLIDNGDLTFAEDLSLDHKILILH